MEGGRSAGGSVAPASAGRVGAVVTPVLSSGMSALALRRSALGRECRLDRCHRASRPRVTSTWWTMLCSRVDGGGDFVGLHGGADFERALACLG